MSIVQSGQIELHEIHTADGEVYDLTDWDARFVLNTPNNLGLPPQTFFTRKRYRGDGVIEVADPIVEPRDIGLQFRIEGGHRNVFWEARAWILDLARPNRTGQLTFVFVRSDGTRRAVTGRAIAPTFQEVSDEWDEWSVEDVLQIRCHNPIVFDPDVVTSNLTTQATDAELVFDITFGGAGIIFGDTGYFNEAGIAYTGTWHSYPTLRIDGPCNYFIVKHVEKGVFLNSVFGIATGDYVILNLADDTYTDQDGNKVFMDAYSDFAEFRIEPDPVLSGGVNTIRFLLPGSDANTAAQVSYTTKYIGI